MLFILSIGMMLMFVQCNDMDITSPSAGDKGTPTSEDELATPELISPSDGAENQAINTELKWKQVEGAKEYHIQVSESEEFASVLVDSISAKTSLTAEGLDPETTYFWKVAPLKKDYMGQWSEARHFTSAAEEQEAVTTELQSPEADAELSGAVVFEWDLNEDAEGYHLQVSADEEFNTLAVDSVAEAPLAEVEALSNSGEYFWRVSPNLSSAPSGWSEVRSFTYTADGNNNNSSSSSAMLISPSNGVEEQATTLKLEWKKIDDAEEYKVQVATDNEYSDLVVDETHSDNEYKLEDLDFDQRYYWRVQDASESEKWSDSWSFHTKPEKSNETSEPPVNNTPGEFVTAENGNFVLNGETFRFAGTNAYYLHNYEKLDPGVVDRALDLFQDAGVSVVRMWGFYDGYDCGYSRNDRNENVIQTAPGEYSEEALRDLDRVIAKGKERGIKFNLALVNYWNELGGICQYNTWAGASNPNRNMDFFINNEQTQKWYKDYVSMLLNRVNTVTGVAYKDEPAIFSWQIANEGRNTGADPKILRDWYQEMAQYIKSIDPNHMVSTGEEGFDNGTPSQYSVDQYSNDYVIRANEGTSYLLNTAIPEIDYGTAHWYAPDFGLGHSVDQNMINAQHAWIKDHAEIAASEGKPFVLSEYGFPSWGDSSVEAAYDDLWSLAEEIQLDGSMLWQLTADETKCYEFGGNICYPGGRTDTNLYNSFKSHIETMNNSR